jgi:hypothetical protein
MLNPGDIAEFGQWTDQFACAIAAYGEIESMKAENQHRAWRSESPAFVESHFIEWANGSMVVYFMLEGPKADPTQWQMFGQHLTGWIP